MSRRAVRALPFLAAVCCAALLSLAVVSAGAASAGREAAVAPAAAAPAAPAAVAVPAVLPPAAGAALCSADFVGRTAADLNPLPPVKKKCDTGKYCAVPQDCQCMGYPCACVSNECICAYP